MGFLKQVGAILKKDVVLELRTKEMLTSMFLFVMLTMVIFNYAFTSETKRADFNAFGGGILWVALLFTAMLGLNRSLVHEKDQGCLEGLLLAPVDRPAIYFGKMIGNLVFMLMVQIVTVPIFTVFFITNNYLPQLPLFVLALLLGDLGIAAVGTLLATISVNTKIRDMMLPILFLPVIVPLLIAAVRAAGLVLAGMPGPNALVNVSAALQFLAAYDSIFLLLAYGVYDFVIGD